MTDKEAIWREISALFDANPRDDLPQPNWTAAEIAELTGRSSKYIRDKAVQLVRQGKLSGQKVRINGNQTWVFWKA